MDKPIKTIPEPTRIPATLVLDNALCVASGDWLGDSDASILSTCGEEFWSLAAKTEGDCFADVGDGDFVVVVDVTLGVGVGVDVEDMLGVGDGLGVGEGVGSGSFKVTVMEFDQFTEERLPPVVV